MDELSLRWGPLSITMIAMIILSPLFALPYFALIKLIAGQVPPIDDAANSAFPLTIRS